MQYRIYGQSRGDLCRYREAPVFESGAQRHGVVEPDEVYLLIATGGIYVDLSAAAIAEPDKVHIFANAGMATAYQLARNEFKPVKPICEQVNIPQAQVPEAHGEASNS